MTKIALLSDIHGNSIALEAVLADIEAQGGVDVYWILGDLVAIGHDPVGVLERLTALPGVRLIRGNTDRYVCTGERPFPTLADAQNNPDLYPRLVEVTATFAWTQGMITAADWFDWLANLPLELPETLPDGTRFLGVHASPGNDDGIGIRPAMEPTQLNTLLCNCQADLICVGHTHVPLDMHFGGKHIVNLGSVSNPITADLRASYVLLKTTSSGYQAIFRQVVYDRQAVIEAVTRLQHPGARFITRMMLGQIRPSWAQQGGLDANF